MLRRTGTTLASTSNAGQPLTTDWFIQKKWPSLQDLLLSSPLKNEAHSPCSLKDTQRNKQKVSKNKQPKKETSPTTWKNWLTTHTIEVSGAGCHCLANCIAINLTLRFLSNTLSPKQENVFIDMFKDILDLTYQKKALQTFLSSLSVGAIEGIISPMIIEKYRRDPSLPQNVFSNINDKMERMLAKKFLDKYFGIELAFFHEGIPPTGHTPEEHLQQYGQDTLIIIDTVNEQKERKEHFNLFTKNKALALFYAKHFRVSCKDEPRLMMEVTALERRQHYCCEIASPETIVNSQHVSDKKFIFQKKADHSYWLYYNNENGHLQQKKIAKSYLKWLSIRSLNRLFNGQSSVIDRNSNTHNELLKIATLYERDVYTYSPMQNYFQAPLSNRTTSHYGILTTEVSLRIDTKMYSLEMVKQHVNKLSPYDFMKKRAEEILQKIPTLSELKTQIEANDKQDVLPMKLLVENVWLKALETRPIETELKEKLKNHKLKKDLEEALLKILALYPILKKLSKNLSEDILRYTIRLLLEDLPKPAPISFPTIIKTANNEYKVWGKKEGAFTLQPLTNNQATSQLNDWLEKSYTNVLLINHPQPKQINASNQRLFDPVFHALKAKHDFLDGRHCQLMHSNETLNEEALRSIKLGKSIIFQKKGDTHNYIIHYFNTDYQCVSEPIKEPQKKTITRIFKELSEKNKTINVEKTDKKMELLDIATYHKKIILPHFIRDTVVDYDSAGLHPDNNNQSPCRMIYSNSSFSKKNERTVTDDKAIIFQKKSDGSYCLHYCNKANAYQCENIYNVAQNKQLDQLFKRQKVGDKKQCNIQLKSGSDHADLLKIATLCSSTSRLESLHSKISAYRDEKTLFDKHSTTRLENAIKRKIHTTHGGHFSHPNTFWRGTQSITNSSLRDIFKHGAGLNKNETGKTGKATREAIKTACGIDLTNEKYKDNLDLAITEAKSTTLVPN